MIEVFDSIILAISNVLYQWWCVPLILILGGMYFSIRTGLIQIRMFPEAIKVVMEKPATEGSISSFRALMISTASRVGTGNIIGVSTAICCGGPGAIFWMWLSAFLGGSSAFIESTLAQVYKKKNPDGSSYGGPAFYMQDALKQRWLGVLFAFFVLLTHAVGYNMLASYNLQSTFAAFSFYDEDSSPMVIGGAKRLVNVTGVLVPVMGIAYVAVAIFVLIINAKNLPAMFGDIFESAFDFEAIFGGFAGSCIMYGVKRGLYSNEAGMGSAPNAAATADVSHPVKQGLVQMLSVFIDTLLICTAMALMCLSSGIAPTEAMQGAPYVQASLQASLGDFGPVFIAIAMSLFAFTTLIGNYAYCDGCIEYIIKRTATKTELICFRIFCTVLVFLGAIASASVVWDMADLCQALMVITNMPTILILGGTAIKCLKDYTAQKKQGLDPHFLAKNIGLKDETDFWN